MSDKISALSRAIRNLAPNREINGLFAAIGASFWVYDPVAEEICWQQDDLDSPRGYRVRKMSIKQALQKYAQPYRVCLLQVIQAALETGFASPVRASLVTDQGPKWVELTAARFTGRDTPLVIGVMQECAGGADAPQRDTALWKAAAAVLASTSAAALIVDPAGTVLWANRSLLELFGIADVRQLLGRDVRTVPNHLGKTLTGKFAQALAGDHDSASGPFERNDGIVIELDYQFQSLAPGTANGCIVFSAEISRAKLLVEAGAVLDALPTPVLVVELDTHRILYANTAGQGELGLSAAQIGLERLTDQLLTGSDLSDLTSVLDTVGWDHGRVWQVDTHLGLKRHYRIRSCFLGKRSARRVVLEFLPAKAATDKPANDRANGFFSRLVGVSFG